MKRLRSYGDDLGSAGEKDLERTSASVSSSSHHRRFHPKLAENGRSRSFIDEDRDRLGPRKRVEYDFGDGFDDRDGAGGSRNCRKRGVSGDYDHGDGFDDREGGVSRSFRKKSVDHDLLDGYDGREREGNLRVSRKRLEHDGDGGFDRRKVVIDRFRDRDSGSASSLVSPRGGYVGDRVRDRDRDRDRDRERIHRSESFCVSRREFPKGFRSERDRLKREDSVSSWRRLGSRSKKDSDDDVKNSVGERGAGSSKAGLDATSSRESLRSPHRMRDVRSPSWSRDSKKSPTWSRDSKKSPTWSLDSKKSPTWSKDSKDSGTETSKVVKKNVSVVVESGGPVSASGSEMEEGELQPEANQEQPGPKSVSEHAAEGDNKAQADAQTEKKHNELESSQHIKTSVNELADENSCHKEMVEAVKSDSKGQSGVPEGVKSVPVMEPKSAGCQSDLHNEVYGNGNKDITVTDDDAIGANDVENVKETGPVSSDPTNCKPDGHVSDYTEAGPTNLLSSTSAAEKEKTLGSIDLEAPAEDLSEPVSIKHVMEEKEPEFPTPILKDKGKGVAVSSPDDANFAGNGVLIERNFIACQDDSMEGPSTRGFELFSTSLGTKADRVHQSNLVKGDDDQLKLESLDLSLGLQMTCLPVASNDVDPPPAQSLPRARSVQSFGTTFRTGSENFTTSISFSGSQFIHNPSCSLTRNSVDYDFEQSVKSRPLFQGIDWQAQSMNDNKQNEVPVLQNILPNGNGSHHLTHASQGMLNGHPVQGQQGTPLGLARSGSFHRNVSAIKAHYENGIRSPTHSAGSHETRSEFSKDKRRGPWEEGSRLIRSSSQRDMPQILAQDSDIVDRIIGLVASQPIQAMAWKIQEMAEQEVACLKDSTCAMILREDKHEKLCMLQEVLKKRDDLTLESLLKAHRVQLEILAALRTGLTAFIQQADDISSKDLAEIFLNLKCRNLSCRSLLPVYDCDCKFCSRKEGFCGTCMCLVCSKFDTASNTCGWVGCDVCYHWCHTDCGLQKSFIRNGHSVASTQGTSEMQFYCVACDHPSEMYGFVKDVFKTCASEWKADIMRKELEYVKRIFGASNDARGKFLHDFANLLLGRLQTGVTVKEVYDQMIGFLNEGESKFANASVSSGKELQALQKTTGEGSNGVTALGQEAPWLKSASVKEPLKLENGGFSLSNNEGCSVRGTWDSDVPIATKKQAPVIDELESIVKIKLAEAQMFQTRADDARREADGLKRIAIAKNEKIDEEHAARISKLRLAEAEERRRQKLEELQMLEKSHREYYNMKLRMEADIKNLLLKMEDTERNLNA